MSTRRKVVLATAAAALAAASLSAAPAVAATQPAPVKVAGTTPSWLPDASRLGAAPAASTLDLRVYLAPNGGTPALKQAVAAVSTPGSASYRHFMSASAYHRAYDPTQRTVDSVSSWLRTNGLAVTGVEANHRYLSVHGTVAQVQKAMNVAIATFQHDGQTVRANTSAVAVPAALAGTVLTVTGLDTTPHLNAPKHVADTPTEPPSPAFVNARPCSTYYGQLTAKYKADFHSPLPTYLGTYLPYAVCGYTGPYLRGAYESAKATQGLDGSGVTIAIVDAYASPTIVEDARTYARRNGDADYLAGQGVQVLPKTFTDQKACGPQGWYGEETLDVEAVHAMAGGANIRYYGAASCNDNDFLNTLGRVVDEDKVQLVTNSWGDAGEQVSPDSINAYENVFLQGALEGIGFMFSSGDSGDELASTGTRQPDFPASDPYVTAVGGTSLAIGAQGQKLGSAGWGTHRVPLTTSGTAWDYSSDSYSYGAGGGNSSLFEQPDYQKGIVPVSNGSARGVPDVGLDADPTTGFLTGQTQTFPDGTVAYGEYRIGGTSLASPLFAGMTALTLQHAGGALGFLNPTIYSQYKTGTFTDIHGTPAQKGNVRVDYVNGVDAAKGLVYSVRTFGQDSTLKTTTGWDDVTGIGEPTPGWITSIG